MSAESAPAKQGGGGKVGGKFRGRRRDPMERLDELLRERKGVENWGITGQEHVDF